LLVPAVSIALACRVVGVIRFHKCALEVIKLMNIGIDVSFLARDKRGMGRVTFNVISRFLEIYEHDFFFIMAKHAADFKSVQQMFPESQIQFLTPKDQKIKDLDVVWFPWNRVDFLPSCRRVVTIHDMAPFRFSDGRKGSEGYRDRNRIKMASEAADRIITPSEFSRTEICTFLEIPQEKIEVIPHGVDECFCHNEIAGDLTAQLLDRFSKGLPYILFVGNVEKRKNVEILIDGFGKAKKSYTFPHKLVLAGKCPKAVLRGKGMAGWSQMLEKIGIGKKAKKNCLMSLTEKLGINEEVIWLGEVSDEDLISLYNLAKLFIFPSFYEGFGLPLLEAMACGVPCIASRIDAHVEVGGGAVEYFAPKNADELAEKIWQIISDSELSNKMKKMGLERSHLFQWNVSAARHMKVLEER
jgi:glycosyltransferase involved in cell wall biosynthesis